jgi:hypothetical protein
MELVKISSLRELVDILNNESIKLPKKWDENKNYISFIHEWLEKFLDNISKVKEIEIDEIKKFCDDLKQCLEIYYSGMPHKAYIHFFQMFEKFKFLKCWSDLKCPFEDPINNSFFFYRARIPSKRIREIGRAHV